MSDSKRSVRGARIAKDDHGSIEGLPLQLMIMGIIASLGTAVIVGWVSSIEAPVYIGQVETDPQEIAVFDEDGDGVYTASIEGLRVRVLDTGGNPIEDAGVLCEGASIDNAHHRLYGSTDANGELVFHDLSFKITGDRIATIRVSISGQGVAGDYWTEIIVLPS
jgi:hypothetical protein